MPSRDIEMGKPGGGAGLARGVPGKKRRRNSYRMPITVAAVSVWADGCWTQPRLEDLQLLLEPPIAAWPVIDGRWGTPTQARPASGGLRLPLPPPDATRQPTCSLPACFPSPCPQCFAGLFLFFVIFGSRKGDATVQRRGGKPAAGRPGAEQPAVLTYRVVKEYPHDASAFLQGLQYDRLCEGKDGAQTCRHARAQMGWMGLLLLPGRWRCQRAGRHHGCISRLTSARPDTA